MYVVATAGHVDHGKSTLVRALTGMEPDRWAEERRRGMTIDLGFAWTTLPSGAALSFVDVPGHERFVPNMLAGVGPVPAVLFVVAADEGWMPQSAEHLAALDAFGVARGLLAVTRADLADPRPAAAQATAALAGTSLADPEVVPVSAHTGAGLDRLRAALDRLVAGLPTPDPAAPVRLWVDRVFTIAGSGTVVTGTLPAGTLRTGDELVLAGGPAPPRPVRVRGLQSLGRPVDVATGVARVAVNLRGVPRDEVARGAALLSPGGWFLAGEVDVRLVLGPAAGELPTQLVVHVGSAAVPARLRPLAAATARLTLRHRLPLRVGDRLLLRDPGRRQVLAGAVVLDAAPPPLRRRGAAAARARDLAGADGRPDPVAELARRRLVRGADLAAAGVPPPGSPVVGDWYADPGWWAAQRDGLLQAVAAYAAAHPLESGLPVPAAATRLGLPDPRLVEALARAAGLPVQAGRVRALAPAALPPAVERAVAALEADLAAAPFAAPEAPRLAALGLGPRELAAAERAGRLLRVADGVVLLPDAPQRAARVLAGLAQPFPLHAAREALGTTRRVAVPLLELLDRRGVTRRLPDDRREVRQPAG